MARPKKKNPRHYIVSTRFTHKEYEWLKNVGALLGTSRLSCVIRYLVNYCMPIDPNTLSPALREIRAAERAGIDLDEFKLRQQLVTKHK